MKVRLKDRLLIVSAESGEERGLLVSWAAAADGHVFALQRQDGQTIRLTDLGARADACREPINVSSRSPDARIQLISNFAHTPFELEGDRYASVEGFWQGLKFNDRARRRAVADLHGQEARRAGQDAPESETVEYGERVLRAGTSDHWWLMELACWAKFNQHEEARRALLGTGQRPLEHRTRRDSRTIPGVIMADIWMKIRRRLGRQAEGPALEVVDDGGDDD